MKSIILSISFLFFTLLLVGNTIPTISLSKVTPEGGVSYNSILCIGEDEMGYIWFGSNDGLFRYNSIDIKRYSHFKNDSSTIPTNRINQLYTDFSGKLWIATENGLCQYKRKSDNFSTYEFKDQFGNFTGKNFNSFFQADDSTYWFATEQGVFTVDLNTNRAFYKNINNKTEGIRIISRDDQGTIWVFFRDGEIYYQPKTSNTFHYFSKGRSNVIRCVLIDNQNIWIAYEASGLLCLNMDGSEKHYYTSENTDLTVLPSNQVRSILKTENNQIWVGTYDGIAILEDYKIVSIINQEKYSELPNHSIWSLFSDSQKNIWIGTYLGGLCFHSPYNNSFFHYTQSAPKSSLSYNVVSSFVQTPDKSEIIVGTEDGNINYFNPETNIFTSVPVSYDGTRVETIKSLTYDINGTLWIGTYMHGILYQEKSSAIFKQLSTPFTTGLQVLDILATDGGIWVSNYPLGVYFYDFKSKIFTNHRHNPLDINTISDDNVRQIIKDKNDDLWFATRNGLNLLKKGSDQFIHFFNQKNNPGSISSNIIYSIHEDDDGILWLGTNGQGLNKFDPETGIAEHYTIKEGLPGNEIFSILQDENKILWITTNQGLCMFNPQTKKIRSFKNSSGIQNNRFNPNAALKPSNGELYFGGTNGFIRFSPDEMHTNPVPPSTSITHFYINNKEVLPGIQQSILNEIIGKTKSLTLNYKQNSISFRFTTNNYINPDKNRFKYRLAGFNNEWIETDANERATFTKVSPGQYTFEVKAANNDGTWNEIPTQISIRIIPPLWERWYAFIIYALFVFMTILYFRQQLINKQKLKNEIELEKVSRENEEYLHQMKLQLFTNISHEFRTPLTLILGPVERLLKAESENEAPNKQFTLIKNNTERLLRLVNQFLDFRKIESGKIQLNPIHTDIISFCKNVFTCFEQHAKHRSLDFRFNSDVPSLKMDFDPDKLDKVLFNILSNAFKNTADGGRINMEIQSNKRNTSDEPDNTFTIGEDVKEDYIELRISDSGKGIPTEKLPHIFDRFYQTENDSRQGTGIGLALSKNYILLHKGQLIVTTELNKGSMFSIYVPQYQSGTLDEKPASHYSSANPVDFSVEPKPSSGTDIIEKNTVQNQEALILVAEDNLELLDYLSELLQNHFRVAKARNGKEAFEQIHSLFPDLVISDIMMPEMDGIELCEKVKDDIRTSHIPVILLTALDTVKDRITGLNSGADAYIPKPFNDDLLIVQINNLLESRKNLRESFNSDQDVWEEKYSSFDIDKKLLLKTINVIESNLTNVDFTVESLADNLNLSRTHLHRKLKALTNQSATEFIRYIRLKHAVKLLQDGEHKVNEVGYAVGFNSHNYFTKSFKKQFGKSPSEFIRENSDIANNQSSI